MAELREWDASFDELESLLRSAGNYVQPSRDLRPRVLEESRLELGEQRARRGVLRAALVAAMLGPVTVSSIGPIETPDAFRQLTLVAASNSFSGPGVSADGSERGWALVEAYTELRRRQADVLRL